MDDIRILKSEYVEFNGTLYFYDPKPGEFGVDDLPDGVIPNYE